MNSLFGRRLMVEMPLQMTNLSRMNVGLTRGMCMETRTVTQRATSFIHVYRLAVGLSVAGASVLIGNRVNCDASPELVSEVGATAVPASAPLPEEEAESIINIYDLSFGTVVGISVGIFIKKGFKILAFASGGLFVVLQYLASRSFITVDWSSMSSAYERNISKTLGPRVSGGGNRLVRLGNVFVDFITANVQSRATLVAGIVLGLRIG